MSLNQLEKRIIELSFKNKLTHVSSCLNTVNVLDRIYQERDADDPVILANSHAALSLYVVLEDNGYCDAQKMIDKHGVHAGRDLENGIYCSGGSLGQAETISLGFALANPDRTVWLCTSDGSCMEGSVSEAFRVAEKHCPNLKVFIVFNGLGAYGSIELGHLPKLPKSAQVVIVDQCHYPEWLRGLAGHYLVLNDAQYSELMA